MPFGRTILIAETTTGQVFEQVGDRRSDLQLLTAGEHLLQGGRHFAGAFHGFGEVLQGHEGHDDAVDLLGDDLTQKLCAVQAVLIGDQYQGAALCERGEELLETNVEADGRELQGAITCLENRSAQLPLDQVQQRCVVHGHTFRLAGASAGEEHVQQVLRSSG